MRAAALGAAAACALLLSACGSSSPPTGGDVFSGSQLDAVQSALDLLQSTSIPRRVLAISYQSGVAPTTCSIVSDPSGDQNAFRLYLAWASDVPGYTTTPKSVLVATIRKDSAAKDDFSVHTFRTRFGRPVPLSVEVNAALARAALAKPNAQCSVLDNGELKLVSSAP